MKFELRPARPADVEAIMQVMADAMANLQHPEWFVPDDAVYMAEHISGPKGFCLVEEEKTTGAAAVTATFWQPCTRIMPPACTPACTAATPLRRTM